MSKTITATESHNPSISELIARMPGVIRRSTALANADSRRLRRALKFASQPRQEPSWFVFQTIEPELGILVRDDDERICFIERLIQLEALTSEDVMYFALASNFGPERVDIVALMDAAEAIGAGSHQLALEAFKRSCELTMELRCTALLDRIAESDAFWASPSKTLAS